MIWLYVTIGMVFFLFINLYYWKKSISSLEKELKQQAWFNAPKKDYILNCYNFVADHYVMQKHAWARAWKNFFYKDCWRKARSIPCHMYALFFLHCLKQRFPKTEVHLKAINLLNQWILLHFYAAVFLEGDWMNIDCWGKKRGVPYGETIRIESWKR